MTVPRPTVPEIKAVALRDMAALARELAPEGEVRSIRGRAAWVACNPTRADTTPGSFVIDIEGPTAGRWMEFAAGPDARSGEGGDVVDLVSYCQTRGGAFKTKEARGAAIEWLAERYGLVEPGAKRGARPRPAVKSDDERAADMRRAEQEKREQLRKRERSARRATAWWLRKGERPNGTAVDLYLTRTRNLPMMAFEKWPGAIRHLPERIDQDGEIHAQAMFCAMTVTGADGKGQQRAVHLTFLTDAGVKDPNVPASRLMWGDKMGAAIRISKGGSRLTPEQAVVHGERKPLVICEGVEDAIVAALLWPDRRVWAAGEVGNIGAIARRYGWPECASEIVIMRDNDPTMLGDRRHPADVALEKSAQDFMNVSKGRPVSIAACIGAHDLNDLWRDAGRAA